MRKLLLPTILFLFALSASASDRLELDFKFYIDNDLVNSETFSSSSGESKIVTAGEQHKFEVAPILGQFEHPLTSIVMYSLKNSKYSMLSHASLITKFDETAVYTTGSEDTGIFRVEIKLKKI